MKFTVLFSEISNQLKEMSRIASSNKPEDTNQNILMIVSGKQLTLRSTDGNIELEAQIPLIDTESEGSTTVNAGKLFEVCSKSEKNATASISLDESTQMIKVETDNTVYEIRSPSADTFPSFEDVGSGNVISLKQKQLKTLIDMSLFCLSNNDFRDYLKGIRFEGDGTNLSVYASDGHRMAMLQTTLLEPLSEPLGTLFTRNCVTQIANIIDGNSEQPVQLSVTKNTVSLICNGYKFKSKLLVCPYPNVRTAIPTNMESEVKVNTKRFSSLVSRVALISSKRINGVTMTFGNNVYSLRASNSERESAIHTEPFSGYETPLVEVSLNASYVTETMSHIKTELTKISFPNPLNSAMICPVNNEEPKDDDIRAQYVISKLVI